MSFLLVQACGSSVRVLCVLYKQTLVRKLTPLVVCIFPTYIPLPNALIDIAKMPSLFHMVLGIPYAAWESVKYEFRATFIWKRESNVFRQPNHLHHKYTPTALNKVTMPMPAKRLLRILSEGALYEKLLRDTLFRKV